MKRDSRAIRVHFYVALVGVLGFGFMSLAGVAAYGDQSTIDVGEAPVIDLVADGNVTVQTWFRGKVQAESNVPLLVRRLGTRRPAPGTQREMRVLSGSVAGPHGTVTLPEETFVVSSLGNAAHDAVMIKAPGGQTTTIRIPASTALLVSRMRHGVLRMENYTAGTFVARVRTGAVLLQNMGGDGFVQVLRGRIVARNSSFNRLRERTAIGNIILERCNVKQIQASSIEGSILYDNGTFEPGLAQFESVNGNVSLGVPTGGVHISARSASGRIFTAFQGTTSVTNRSYEATALIRGGGPLVSAASTTGAIFLYDHAIRHVPAELRRPRTIRLRKPVKARISAGRPHRA